MGSPGPPPALTPPSGRGGCVLIASAAGTPSPTPVPRCPTGADSASLSDSVAPVLAALSLGLSSCYPPKSSSLSSKDGPLLPTTSYPLVSLRSGRVWGTVLKEPAQVGWRGQAHSCLPGQGRGEHRDSGPARGVAGKCDLPRVLGGPLKGQWVWRGEDEAVGGYGIPEPKPGWGQQMSAGYLHCEMCATACDCVWV